jgi:hypothetical protein
MISLVVLVVMGAWLGYGVLRGREHERRLAYSYLWVAVAAFGIILIAFIPGLLGWGYWITKKPYKVIEGIFYRWFVYDWPSLSRIGESVVSVVDRFIEKTYYIPLPLAGFGLWWRVKAKEVSAAGLYLAFLMVVLIISLFPFPQPSGRYHLPAIFLLYLTAGFGFAKVRELIKSRFRRYPWLAAVIPVIIIVGAMLSFALQPQRPDKSGYKEAGLWLQKQSATPPLILTDDPRVAYYAGGEYIAIPPEAKPEEVVTRGIKEERADYLVMEGKGTAIADAFAPFEKKGELKLVLSRPSGRKGRTIYVYEIKK